MERFFTKIVGGSESRGRSLMIILIVLGFVYMGLQLYTTFNKPIDEKYYYDPVNDGVNDVNDIN
ncbi:hypothetical protein GW793_00135 [bacterium]|uniref:Uncharacterized protein n=2 Tax=Katanobacteria TaxID=422282 RepID=A0A2M7X2D7_UNCKA|nr:hypothetical protein [bacterium]PIP56760.1 MAG: hypothetical protein COX05_01285 [candidate division WWE3 bacterium CG22_combo_CG10-13_8_21_14_all_39_12]PJA40333.1 MAG: hypothetical protein CO179_02565 [candidate division WWE3 bacterium CG_4_9_14_3_um_filter_39_7]